MATTEAKQCFNCNRRIFQKFEKRDDQNSGGKKIKSMLCSSKSTSRITKDRKYHSNRGYSQEFLHHIIQPKSSKFSRQGNNNDKKMISVDVFKIKLITGYVSSIRTLNSKRENIY